MTRRIFISLITVLCLMTGLQVILPVDLAAAAGAPPYRIDVDIANQTVTVYSVPGNIIVRQMVCSSGTGNKTPRGTFKLTTRKSTDRKPWYYIRKYKCYVRYATRIKGPYLFHSLPYKKKNLDTLDQTALNKLGSKASHGCIRLLWEDAKWISDHCPNGTPVHIFSNGSVKPGLKEALLDGGYSVDSGISYDQYLRESCVVSRPDDIGRGSDTERIRSLQMRLTGLGLLRGGVTGKYDNATIDAVRRYQRSIGLPAAGIVVPELLQRLMSDDSCTDRLSTLEVGANGPVVAHLQTVLAKCGIYPGEPNGVYDSALAEAVTVLDVFTGGSGTPKADPSLLDKADALLSSLNERYGEGKFGTLFESETVRTVKTKSKTKLYKSASTKSRKLKTVKKNKVVTLLSEGKTFYRVSYGGKTGYIKKSALKNIYTLRFTLSWGIPVDDLGEQDLSEENIGAAVSALQSRLNALGFYPGEPDECYSEALSEAVRAYQTASGLEPTGRADIALQRAIRDSDAITGTSIQQAQGDDNPAVAGMQRRLKALQYYDGDCTGRFDDATSEAVKLFTRSNGFPESAIATTAVQEAIRDQFEACESTYGSGNYHLVITEVHSSMAKLKKAEKLYKSASTCSRNLKSVKKNAEVFVISKGKTWSNVSIAGKTGYMRNKRLKFFTRIDYVAEFNPPDLPEPTETETDEDGAEGASGDGLTPSDDDLTPPADTATLSADDAESCLEIDYEPVPEDAFEIDLSAEDSDAKPSNEAVDAEADADTSLSERADNPPETSEGSLADTLAADAA